MTATLPYDAILADVRSGTHLRTAHPHAFAALAACPANAVLGGSYCAWRFSPRRDTVRCPFALEIIVYGASAQQRRDAFRDVVDALLGHDSVAEDVACVASTTRFCLGDAGNVPVWNVSSAAWSLPVRVVLSPYATLEDATRRYGDADVMDAYVVARRLPTPLPFSVVWRNDDACAFRGAVCAATVRDLRDELSPSYMIYLASLGYAYAPPAGAEPKKSAVDSFALRADDPAVWRALVTTRMACGVQLAPYDAAASMCGGDDATPVFRFAPLHAYCLGLDAELLSYVFFGVYHGADGLVFAKLADRETLHLSAPHSSARRSYFDTACLLYDDVRAHFFTV